jgi:putative endonuclease
MGCWTYVLQSQQDGSFYVGITSHLRARIKDHNAGRNRSTAAGRPWVLLHREEFPDHASARAREKFLKSGMGREFLETLKANSPSTPIVGR